MKDNRTTLEVMLDTWNEGRDAARLGRSVEENPYTMYPGLSRYWVEGHDSVTGADRDEVEPDVQM